MTTIIIIIITIIIIIIITIITTNYYYRCAAEVCELRRSYSPPMVRDPPLLWTPLPWRKKRGLSMVGGNLFIRVNVISPPFWANGFIDGGEAVPK